MPSFFGHVIDALDQELEKVWSKVDSIVSMQLEDSKLGQPCHQNHDPVVVRLYLGLVNRADS